MMRGEDFNPEVLDEASAIRWRVAHGLLTAEEAARDLEHVGGPPCACGCGDPAVLDRGRWVCPECGDEADL